MIIHDLPDAGQHNYAHSTDRARRHDVYFRWFDLQRMHGA
jgi:hypothetical protein